MEQHSCGLLIFDGMFHPPWLGRRNLERSLRSVPGWDFLRISSVEKLPQLPLDSFQCMALYFHHKRVSPSALDSLDRYVKEGGGLLVVHCASASFKKQPQYFQILGGRFREHGSVQELRIDPTNGENGPFSGIPTFTVRDEPFRHEYESTNQIHFTTTIESEIEPVVWTKEHGKGRVCYCSLGHTIEATRNPHVLEILRRGLLWCAGTPLEAIRNHGG
jgi:type 1 glutamine amidotransferase